jgi:hypothetical protein
MGGGDTYYTPPRTADESEKVFRDTMDEIKQITSEEKVKNIFISFAMEDEKLIQLLRSQSKDPDFDMRFRDYSVKEPLDEKWKMRVRQRISQTSGTIVAIGKETAKSQAVNWEIDESYKQGKKVIGVRLYRDRTDPLPPALILHKSPIINWDTKKIKMFSQDP